MFKMKLTLTRNFLWASICLQLVTFCICYLLKAKARPLYMDEHLPKSGVIFGLKFSEFVSSFRQMLKDGHFLRFCLQLLTFWLEP